MQSSASTFAFTLLLLASCAVTACDDSDDATTANPTGPSRFVVGSFSAEPSTVSAEFQAGSGCLGESPFDARINVHVRPQQELFLRGIGFEFVPIHGRRVRPLAFPGRFELNNAVLPPIPVPTSHPIPFPGEVPMSNIAVPAGAFFKGPFRLRFDCGVPARGTLFVTVEAADRRGTVDVSRFSAQIGH
jgi:hypothetical protein